MTRGRPRVLLGLSALLPVLLVSGCGSVPFQASSVGGLGSARPTAAPTATAETPSPGPSGAVPSGAAPTSLALCTSPQSPFPRRLVQRGAYSVEPDQWNATGQVCLATEGDTGFTLSAVNSLVPRTKGTPGAYPNTATATGAAGLPVPVGALGDATVEWNASTAGVSGSYDLAFDLWYGPNASSCDSAASAEVMVWLDSTNDVQPAGDPVGAGVALAGTDYQVFQAAKTSPHTVISYVRKQPTHSVHRLDLRLFTQDALLRGYVPPQSYLCKVSAGFEIWSGGVGLRSWSFAFDNMVGLPAGELAGASGSSCLRSGGTAGNSTAGNSTALVGACAGGGAGRWTLGNDGSVSQAGACLQGSGGAGTAVTLATCSGDSAQRWSADYADSADADGRLVNARSGLCLDSVGGSGAVGSGAVLRPCSGAASQRWRLPYNGLV